MRQVLIYPGENGYWVAECPSLPGCVSQGTTREEAVTNIREAIEGDIQVLKEEDDHASRALQMTWRLAHFATAHWHPLSRFVTLAFHYSPTPSQ